MLAHRRRQPTSPRARASDCATYWTALRRGEIPGRIVILLCDRPDAPVLERARDLAEAAERCEHQHATEVHADEQRRADVAADRRRCPGGRGARLRGAGRTRRPRSRLACVARVSQPARTCGGSGLDGPAPRRAEALLAFERGPQCGERRYRARSRALTLFQIALHKHFPALAEHFRNRPVAEETAT